VQRHRLGALEQLLQTAAGAGIAQRKLVLQVVEQHSHAQGLGQDGQLAPDVAVADDAQRAAADLVAAGCRFVPDSGVQCPVAVDQPPSQADDLCDRQLYDAAGVGVGGVEHRYPGGGRRNEVDLIGADAECADSSKTWVPAQDVRRHLRLRPDAQQLDPGQGLHQVLVVQRSPPGVHVVAGRREQVHRHRVDVLEQQGSGHVHKSS
jgi:hypothetical protein